MTNIILAVIRKTQMHLKGKRTLSPPFPSLPYPTPVMYIIEKNENENENEDIKYENECLCLVI